MQLWTLHPEELRIDDPDVIIDPTLGAYWNDPREDFRYREVLPLFQERIDSDQFLWCCIERNKYILGLKAKIIEWELNIPDNSKIRLFKTQIWEDLLYSRRDDWDDLFVENVPTDSKGISAVAVMPLEESWIVCHGLYDINNFSPDPP